MATRMIVGRSQRDEADQDGDGADLGQRGDEARGFVGGALIDVGGPEVEGEHGQLVVKAAKGQRQAGDGQWRVDYGLEPGQQVGQRGGAGQAEEVAQAEEHQAVGGDAEHDVFDRGFHLALLPLPLAPHGHHEVEGESGDFQGDDERDDVHATHEQSEADDAQGEKEEVFGFNVVADVLEVSAQKEHECVAASEDQLEGLGELVHAVCAAKEGGFLPQAKHAGDDGSQRGDQRSSPGLGRAGLAESDHEEDQRAG